MKEASGGLLDKAGLRGTLSLSTMDEKGLPESIATTTEEAVARQMIFMNSVGNIRD